MGVDVAEMHRLADQLGRQERDLVLADGQLAVAEVHLAAAQRRLAKAQQIRDSRAAAIAATRRELDRASDSPLAFLGDLAGLFRGA